MVTTIVNTIRNIVNTLPSHQTIVNDTEGMENLLVASEVKVSCSSWIKVFINVWQTFYVLALGRTILTILNIRNTILAIQITIRTISRIVD